MAGSPLSRPALNAATASTRGYAGIGWKARESGGLRISVPTRRSSGHFLASKADVSPNPSILVAEPEDHLLHVGEVRVRLIVGVFGLGVEPVPQRQIGVDVELRPVVDVLHGGAELVILGEQEEAAETAE